MPAFLSRQPFLPPRGMFQNKIKPVNVEFTGFVNSPSWVRTNDPSFVRNCVAWSLFGFQGSCRKMHHSLHPLCSPSAKENLWTFYRQPPSVWGEHTWKYSILFPKVSIFFQSTLKLCCILQKKRGLILPRFFTPRIYNRRHRHFLYNRVYWGAIFNFFRKLLTWLLTALRE